MAIIDRGKRNLDRHFVSPEGLAHKRRMSWAMRRAMRRKGYNTVSSNILRRLGKVSDVELARVAGVHHSTIRYWRWKRGVPSWRSGKLILSRPGMRLGKAYWFCGTCGGSGVVGHYAVTRCWDCRGRGWVRREKRKGGVKKKGISYGL